MLTENLFTKHSVMVYNPQQRPIITGWWGPTSSKLWCIYLRPDPTAIPMLHFFQLVVARDTKAVQVSNTVEFSYHFLTQLTLTNEDRILYSMNNLLCALINAPTVACDA